jgi:hypothetical protein
MTKRIQFVVSALLVEENEGTQEFTSLGCASSVVLEDLLEMREGPFLMGDTAGKTAHSLVAKIFDDHNKKKKNAGK